MSNLLQLLSLEMRANNVALQQYDEIKQNSGNYETSVENEDGTTSIFRFENKNLVYSETTDVDGNKSNIYTGNYESDGSYYKTLDTDNDGTVDVSRKSVKDENGNEILFEEIVSDGLCSRFEDSYNEKGQLATSLHYFFDTDNNNLGSGLSTYSYDDLGRVIAEEYDKDNDGTIDEITSYEYDEYSRVAKETIDKKSNDNMSVFGKALDFVKSVFGNNSDMDMVINYEYPSEYITDKYQANKEVKYCYVD